MTPQVLFHAGAGAIGILAGAVALFSRKGARVHRTAGRLFFVAMGTTAASAIWLGFSVGETNNAIAGILTLYMLATAFMAVKRGERETGLFELVAFVLAASGAAIAFWFALQSVRNGTAFMGGIPAFSFSAVIALAAMFDLSAILRRGLAGRQRIARHLWRVHMGYFTAVGSFFPGQLQLFPAWVREQPTIVLFTPPFLVVGLMVFWLAFVFFTKRFAAAPARAPGV